MGFHEMIAIANRAEQKAFGEPQGANLIFKSSRIPVEGIYLVTPGGVSPLDGRTILPGTYFSCLATDVIGVGPGWYVDVKNQVLPVIAAVPDGMGRVELYLGDPE